MKKIIPVILFLQALGAWSQAPVDFATSDQYWAPFYSLNTEGKEVGLVPDLLNLLIVQRLGMEFSINPFPWIRAQEMVKAGTMDFTISLPTPARLEYSVASDRPLYSIYFKVYVRKDHPRLGEINQVKTLDDIKSLGLTVVSNVGNNWIKTNVESRGIPTSYVRDDVTILRFLELGRADITIDSPLSLTDRIRTLGFGERILETGIKFDEVWFHILWSKKSPYYSQWPRINREITAMTSSPPYQALLKKWLGK